MKKRNGTVSLWKFIFAIVIVLFHASAFYPNWNNYFVKGGYIAVEFFYVISGYYLAKNILNKKSIKKNIGKETVKYVLQTIIKLFPYILIAYIFSMVIILSKNTFKISDIANSIWNLLLLRQAGFSSRAVSPQLWYITSMVLAMSIFIPLLKKYKENFISCVSPLIVIFILGFLNHNWTGLDHVNKIWVGIMYTGTLRAIAEMNIGFIIYEINCINKTIEYTKLFKIILSILSEVLLFGVIFIIQFAPNPKVYDYVMLLMISISILIITSDKTIERKYLDRPFIYYLEKLSMPMFINHVFIIDFFTKINLNELIPLKGCSIIAVIVTIIFSALEIKIIEKILTEKNINKFKQKIISKT